MSADGSLPQAIRQHTSVIDVRIALQQGKAQSAQAMGSARHQPVAWTGISSVQAQGSDAPKCSDRDEFLIA